MLLLVKNESSLRGEVFVEVYLCAWETGMHEAPVGLHALSPFYYVAKRDSEVFGKLLIIFMWSVMVIVIDKQNWMWAPIISLSVVLLESLYWVTRRKDTSVIILVSLCFHGGLFYSPFLDKHRTQCWFRWLELYLQPLPQIKIHDIFTVKETARGKKKQ